MDFFSYFSFLSSIILALGITRLFSGIGTILEHRGKAKLYWVHLLWALNLLLFMVLEWILYAIAFGSAVPAVNVTVDSLGLIDRKSVV